MKKVILSIVFILSCSFIRNVSDTSGYNQIPQDDRIALKIIDKTATALERKYDIHRCGFGMNGGDLFRTLEIEFQVFNPLSRDEARNILFACVKEFLNNINSNEEIKPFLSNYPFTHENVSFTLYIYDKNHRDLFHPNISVASIGRRGLTFKTDDPNDEFKYKETSTETYKEALQLVNKMNEKDIH